MMQLRFGLLATAIITTFIVLSSAGASINSTSYNYTSANQMVNNATNYVNTLNMSGYLVFYPNLTQAYSYLNKSYLVLNSSPNSAVQYANLASSSAYFAYLRTESYRQISLAAVVIFTLAIAVLLRFQMTPVKRQARPKVGRKKA